MDIGRILFRKSSRSTSKREIKWTKKNYYKVSQKIGRSVYVIVISEGVCKNRKTSDKIGAVGISGVTTDSNLKKYNIHPKERPPSPPSGHTLPWRTWRTAKRVRSKQAPAAKHLWGYRESNKCTCGAATCDLKDIMTRCKHFGERPSRDNIAKIEHRSVRWMSAVTDTTMMMMGVKIQSLLMARMHRGGDQEGGVGG